MSARDIGTGPAPPSWRAARTCPEGYESLPGHVWTRSLNLITDVMEAYTEDDAADAAVHFALLSYAAGLASDRYMTLLRNAQGGAEEKAPREKKAKKPKENK
jgi:hypothetical protein